MDFSYESLSSIPSNVMYHVREKNVNWPMFTYTALIHAWALKGAWLVTTGAASSETCLFAFTLWPLTGLGITAGVHRLWSHRSYTASLPLRIFLMLMNSIANQGSILHWAKDHRVHHAHSETIADPHDATRGFFFAHIGWLWLKKRKEVVVAGKKMDFSDLKADPVVAFQNALDPWFALFMCFYVAPFCAVRLWGEDFWTAFYVVGALRVVYVLHCTFLVNSAAHLYGDHPYDESIQPAENPVVSFFAIGEGWHNWHHKYPHDYSCSEFGISSQFNPTKIFIDTGAWLGLAWGRKRAEDQWGRARARRDIYFAKETASEGDCDELMPETVSSETEEDSDGDCADPLPHSKKDM